MKSGNNKMIKAVMEKTYHELLRRYMLNPGCKFVDCENIELSRCLRDYTSQMKISPGSNYEKYACELIEDGNLLELIANLVSIEMVKNGEREGINNLLSTQ